MEETSKLATLLMKRRFFPKMTDILETEEQTEHSVIVEHIKQGVNDEKILKEVPTAKDAVVDAWVCSGDFTPVWPPVTLPGCLHDDIIFVAIKVALNGCTVIVARTYGVDQPKELKQNYQTMLQEQEQLVRKQRVGEVISNEVIEKNGVSQQIEVLKGSDKFQEGDVFAVRTWCGKLMIVDTFRMDSTIKKLTLYVQSAIKGVFFSFKSEEKKEPEVLTKFREKKVEETPEDEQLKMYEQQRNETIREETHMREDYLNNIDENPICYNKESEMPAKNPMYIATDVRKFALLLPINGRLVPFHVKYVKGVTTREGFFRVNFNVPKESDEGMVYVKELSFHVRDKRRIDTVEGEFKDMKKRWVEEERIRSVRSMSNEKLVLGTHVPVLRAVCMNPVLSGKKTEGTLEAHTNGFRFTSSGGNVELLYRNIQHAFFQDGKYDTVILFHFMMNPPVIVQNHTVTHIQFYNEIMDASLNIDKNDRYYTEADEAREEEREKRIRAKYNHLYTEFINKLKDEKVPVKFEFPFRDLKFGGTIKRNTCTLQPTISCLVNITDSPYKVIELDTIDIVVFERLARQLTLKNFDMVIIFKDHKKDVLQVSSVSKSDLDHIKKWLTKCEIKFYETPQSLNWPNIMETVNNDPEGFKKTGWSFLDERSSQNDDSEEEPVFSMDEEMERELDEEDDLSTDLSSEEETSTDEEDEDEDEGQSWSELEEEALKDDAEKERKEQRMFGREEMMHRRNRAPPVRRQAPPQRSATIQNFFKKTSLSSTPSTVGRNTSGSRLMAPAQRRPTTSISISRGVGHGYPYTSSAKRKP